jgi:hypothetical protein
MFQLVKDTVRHQLLKTSVIKRDLKQEVKGKGKLRLNRGNEDPERE